MHLLSVLLETYLWHEEDFGKRRMIQYLEQWAAENTQEQYDFRADLGYKHNSAIFKRIVAQEISEELLLHTAMDEYKRGCFDCAAEFLFYKPYIMEKLRFPYTIDYSDRTDGYFTKERNLQGEPVLSGDALEEFIRTFLKDYPQFQ